MTLYFALFSRIYFCTCGKGHYRLHVFNNMGTGERIQKCVCVRVGGVSQQNFQLYDIVKQCFMTLISYLMISGYLHWRVALLLYSRQSKLPECIRTPHIHGASLSQCHGMVPPTGHFGNFMWKVRNLAK